MTTKHTPGPWHAFTGWVKGPGSESICFKESGPGNIEQDDANLRLIAAAPELLAVLKDALRDRATWIADRQDALSLAMLAAIARAEPRP